MEKETGSKEVKMQAVPGKKVSNESNREQKLSYEELNQACAEMSQQLQTQSKYIQQMHKQMQEMQFALQTKRVDYLFKVVELGTQHVSIAPIFDETFVRECASEIQESLTIPSTEENSPKKD